MVSLCHHHCLWPVWWHVSQGALCSGTVERDKEQDFATSQLQKLLCLSVCLSVYIWTGLFIDCLTLSSPLSPRFGFTSCKLKCNAKIVKYALFSPSHFASLGADGRGLGRCNHMLLVRAVMSHQYYHRPPAHSTWCFPHFFFLFSFPFPRTIVYAVLIPMFVSSFFKSLYPEGSPM